MDQDKRVSDTMEITKVQLKSFGYIKNESVVVKILGDGDYAKHLTFTGIEHFSKSAQDKMVAPSSVKSWKIKVQSIKEQKIAKEAAKAAALSQKSVKSKVIKSKVEKDESGEKAKKVEVKKVIAKPLLETEEVKPVKKVVKKVEWEVKKPTVVAGKSVVKKPAVAPKKSA